MEKDVNFTEMDYISWLKMFHKFHLIPRHFKYGQSDYKKYVKSLREYLHAFCVKAQPLIDVKQIVTKKLEEFEAETSELMQWVVRNNPPSMEATRKAKRH